MCLSLCFWFGGFGLRTSFVRSQFSLTLFGGVLFLLLCICTPWLKMTALGGAGKEAKKYGGRT